MRIAFLGTVEFSRRCLAEVLACGGDVAAVLTLSQEAAGFNADWADLAPVAAAHGVPCHRIRNINDPETVELLRSLAPDVLFVFGWSQLVSQPVLELPRLGAVGTHPALLPRGRGRHPLTWALVEGLSESGLTFFYLDEGADSGDILWQRAFPIEPTDEAADLYAKICDLAAVAIREFLPQLQDGTAPRRAQDDTLATYWRKRNDDDRIIHWEAPTMTTYNLVRGLAPPYIGATTTHGDTELVVRRARLNGEPLSPADEASPPGTVLARSGDEFDVRTGDGRLTLVDVDAGGSALPAPGARLGGAA